jgi:hypothetical protein
MDQRYIDRLTLAVRHAYEWNIKLVFCIMGPPWVVKAFIENLNGYYWDDYFAIIGHDWRDFGKLPAYEFGGWREDLDSTQAWLKRRSRCGEGLSFDPTKYPRKSKKQEKPKKPKVKSNKPRYISPNYEDEIPWQRDPSDR